MFWSAGRLHEIDPWRGFPKFFKSLSSSQEMHALRKPFPLSTTEAVRRVRACKTIRAQEKQTSKTIIASFARSKALVCCACGVTFSRSCRPI